MLSFLCAAVQKLWRPTNQKPTIAKKTGKIKGKKGLKNGTYKLKIRVRYAGNANYGPYTKTVALTIEVR